MKNIEETIYNLAAGDARAAKKHLRAAILEGPGFETLGQDLNIPPKSLMRMTSSKGNPTLSNFTLILKALLQQQNKTLSVHLKNQSKSTQRQIYLNEMAEKYIWWQRDHIDKLTKRRILAQVMDLGDLKDTEKMHQLFKRAELTGVLKSARPGWFHPKSWNYWNVVLGRFKPGAVAKPPERKTR